MDDELAPHYLQRVLPAAGGNDAVFHFTDFIDEQSRALQIRWSFDPAALRAEPAATLLLQPQPTMSSLLRRATFLALGGFDERRSWLAS